MRVLLFSLILLGSMLAPRAEETNKIHLLLQPAKSPLVSFRILFSTGAAYDPPGKEGVAALTAAMLAEAGSQKFTYEEILKRMYPMAVSLSWQTDKEMTVFSGSTHLDNLPRYFKLVQEMILTPGFRQEDFNRLKTNALNFLKVSLREGNDEELGKEHLYNVIYAGHPYGHHNSGSIGALEKLTLDDVKAFYKEHYTRANLAIGIAGGFPDEFPNQVKTAFAALPEGKRNTPQFPTPKLENGIRFHIIQRDTRSTAFSLGFPISVRRGHKDYPALALATSFFGQHRSSSSYLFQRLREARGLNYGDYAYIEYFPRGMYQFHPDPNLARQHQIFQIWLRPVPPDQAHFTLRAALFEFDKLVRHGLTQEQFESTRDFLSKYVDILLQTQSARLGYALDSEYYGIPEYSKYLKEGLAKLTLKDVNAAIKRHLTPAQLQVVIVTKEGDALKEAIVSGKPSPISYNSPKPEELLEEDKLIEKFPIRTEAEWVKVIPVTNVFQ